MLTALFYLIVTPAALVLRLLGIDPISSAIDSKVKTYWKSYDGTNTKP